MTAATQTPTALCVPKANASGKLAIGWFDLTTFFLGIVDTAFSIVDAADATKKFLVEVNAGQTAGKALTFDTGPQTDNYSLSAPVLTANDTLVTLGTVQTIGAQKTFTAAPIVSALIASRLVRTDGSKALESNAALTATYVLFADANGWPTTDAGFVYNAATDQLALGGSTPQLRVNVPAATNQNILSGAGSTTGATYCGFSNTSGSFLMGVNGSVAGFLGTSTTAYATVLMSFVAQPLEFGANATCYQRIASTGEISVLSTTEVTLPGTAGLVVSGGAIVSKTLAALAGLSVNVDSTVSAAGTTAMAQTSKVHQILTGSTTHTHTLPAATLRLAYFFKNKSSGTWTIQRAGSDTIYNSSSVTSITLTAGQGAWFISDGTSEWSVIRV